MAVNFLKTNLFLGGSYIILILILNIKSTPEPVTFNNAKAWQSETFLNFEANLAIDGNLETCSMAEDDGLKLPLWWRVNFDKAYNIENLMIHLTSDQSETRVSNAMKVYVSTDNFTAKDDLCHSFWTVRHYVRIKCEKILYGHTVAIVKDQKTSEGLKLCEVQVNVDFTKLNIAFGRPTSYSSLAKGSKEESIVDGNKDSCATIKTSVKELVWWRVELDDSYYISNVIMYFQADSNEEASTSIFVNVYVSNNEDSFKDYFCGFTENPTNKVDINNSIVVKCDRPVLAIYVTIQKYAGLRPWLMILCEVEIFFREDISDIKELSLFRVNLFDSITSQNQYNPNHNSKMATDGNPDTCSMSEEFSYGDHPWWRLELDTFYDISELIIISHKIYSFFMNSLNIYISKNSKDFEENLCASFLGSSNIFFVNLAFKRKTFQSGILPSFKVDGNIETCALISADHRRVAWWRVVLDTSYYVTDVNVHFLRNLTEKYNYDINIYVSNHESYYEEHKCGIYSQFADKVINGSSVHIKCNKATFGSYVTIKKHGENLPLNRNLLLLCEVEVFSKEDPKETTKDELNFKCLSHEYTCQGGNCIPKEWLCDGTFDCHLGDDEVPSCKMKCEEGKFKCTKRDLCIDMTAVCDGNVDCQDYSDENSCFQTHTGLEFLTATFKGETEFYICSQGWKIDYSIDICQQIASIHLATRYQTIKNKTSRFLTLEEEVYSNKSAPAMDKFTPSSQCQTEHFVKIHCDYRAEGFCGTRDDLSISNFGPYIIKGENAKQGAWPWQAQLISYERYCGGSIISERWIITAAHCIYNRRPSKFYIKVGSVKFNDPYLEKLEISHVATHPQYVEGLDAYDIALLRLSSPLTFTSLIRPICLPGKELSWRELMSYRHCVVVGFGRTEAGSSTKPDLLQQSRMNIMSNEECARYISVFVGEMKEIQYEYRLESNKLFCVGSVPTAFGRNICMGNSGNGFVCQDKHGIWTLVGIVASFFEKSGYPCSSSVFTHVDQHLDFIHRVMEKGEFLLSKHLKAHENGIVLMVIAAIFNKY